MLLDFEESEMSLALVTGGAGFIGSHLVRALIDQDYDVRVLDDLSTGLKENLEGLDIELIRGDIRDRSAVAKAVKGAELVFHYAAMISVPDSVKDPHFCYDVNVNGSLNVLWESHETGVKRVILASSAAVYGDTLAPVNEQAPSNPKSPYASAKVAMEGMARMFSATYRLPTVCLRYFNVYGPRQSPHSPYAAAIPLFINAFLSGNPPIIFGDGQQTRDFVYVDDVVRANLLAIDCEHAIGGVYNIAGHGPIAIATLVSCLRDFFPESAPTEFRAAREGDIRFSAADQMRAVQALGYRPEIALEQGLQRTVQWFRTKLDREGK
jgi:nucleoside-diphosphate-sugar epimerase